MTAAAMPPTHDPGASALALNKSAASVKSGPSLAFNHFRLYVLHGRAFSNPESIRPA
jgi:hypothetical protein